MRFATDHLRPLHADQGGARGPPFSTGLARRRTSLPAIRTLSTRPTNAGLSESGLFLWILNSEIYKKVVFFVAEPDHRVHRQFGGLRQHGM